MHKTMGLAVLFGLSLILATGCGDDGGSDEPTYEGEAPLVEALTFTPAIVPAGQTATLDGAFTVRDADGDVGWWRARVVGPTGQERETGRQPISGHLGTHGELRFQLQIPQPAPGDHTFYVSVVDAADHVSNELSGTFTAE